MEIKFEFYRAKEIKEGSYIKIPKQFYSCLFYKKMLNPTARELYGFLKDRMNLSLKEENIKNFTDKDGYVYIVFTRDQVMELLGISKSTCSNAFKALNDTGLIYEKRQGQGNVNLIYIGKVKYMTEIEAIELLESIEKSNVKQKSKKQTSRSSTTKTVQKSKNRTSKGLKNEPLKVQNLDGNNTDLNKTDFKEEEEAHTQYSLSIDRKLTPAEKKKITALVETYSKDLVIKAIDIAVLKSKSVNLAYIVAVLEDWNSKGLNTLQEVEVYLKNENKRVKKGGGKSSNKKDSFSDYEGQRDFKSYYGKMVGSDGRLNKDFNFDDLDY